LRSQRPGSAPHKEEEEEYSKDSDIPDIIYLDE
jgi:hypothetical protein